MVCGRAGNLDRLRLLTGPPALHIMRIANGASVIHCVFHFTTVSITMLQFKRRLVGVCLLSTMMSTLARAQELPCETDCGSGGDGAPLCGQILDHLGPDLITVVGE